jgi:alkanesulfonate monooxygenase
MSFLIHWQLDVAGEPSRSEPSLRSGLPALIRDLRRPTQNRFDYYAQVAQAVAQTGFDGLYLPFRSQADDTRIVAAVLAREIRHIALIPEFPASAGSAVYAAKQTATFQRGTHGRLGWAIAPNADAATRLAQGDLVDEEDLPQRLAEFLTVARGVYETKPFSFKGDFFEVENGGFADPLNRFPFPQVHLRGARDSDLAISARHGDVHLFDAATDLADGLGRLRALADAEGRKVALGVLQPVLARETAAEAARDAQRGDLAPGTIVGDYDSVAQTLTDLAAHGITHMVLSATPQLEEAYRFGQHVLPRLRARLAARSLAA